MSPEDRQAHSNEVGLQQQPHGHRPEQQGPILAQAQSGLETSTLLVAPG